MLNPDHEASDLVTTLQAAELRGVSAATINRWARSGALPVALKVPGRTGANLFRRSDVIATAPEADVA